MFNITSLHGGIDNIKDITCGGVNIGLKTNPSNDKSKLAPDIAFIKSNCLMNVEALFTNNKFQAAPIVHYKKYDKGFKSDFILINAKNANALTGENGVLDIEDIFKSLNKKIKVTNPIMSSTGIIGKRLDKQKIISSFDKFDFNNKNSNDTAQAIMTTDKNKKEIALRVTLEDGSSFNISGICKGAGMIEPSMATMLCFIVTDANVPKDDMYNILQDCNKDTFNAISVDGDTSTNDTVLLLSNGSSNVYDKRAFIEALYQIMQYLSLEIVKDGEGAKKLVAFKINGAKSKEEAIKASKALSNSLLVKTALFGEDINWGRIASTIGSSGVLCKEDRLKIYYDNIMVYDGDCDNFTEDIEKKATCILQKDSYTISCNLGMGEFSYTTFGCDLGYEYIKINADYRT